MKEEIFEFVEKLALKMGTTAENFWMILIRQAKITAILYSALLVIFLGIGLGLYELHLVFSYPRPLFDFETDSVKYTLYEWYGWKIIIPYSFSLLAYLIYFFALLSKLGIIVTGIYNPGYLAINDISNRFKR